MALLAFPRSLSLPSSSLPNSHCRLRTSLRSSSLAVASVLSAAVRPGPIGEGKAGAAVLWFKHDLRIDDHPGLAAASRFRTVVPLYIFDRRILSRFSDEMLELLLLAVEDLKRSLKDQGSDLLIRYEGNFKHYPLILLPSSTRNRLKLPIYLPRRK